MKHRRREPASGVFRLVLPLPFPGLDRVNAYLLDDSDGKVLIDCGIWDPALEPGHGWDDLVAALEACGCAPGDIAVLIVTHPHIDHYGLAGKVVEATGCELWMHERAVADLESYQNPGEIARDLESMLHDHGVPSEEIEELGGFEDWRSFVHSFVEPTRLLRGGETVRRGEYSWRIVYTPGHSDAHICLWEPDERALVSGDTLLGAITPHIDFRRDSNEDPLGRFLESLKLIEELEPELVLPGHGRPFGDGADRARVIERHHDRRLGSILQVIRHEPHTANEITEEIFGSTLLNFHKRLALGEALAHLAYLRRNDEIERIRRDDGVYLYRKISRGNVS